MQRTQVEGCLPYPQSASVEPSSSMPSRLGKRVTDRLLFSSREAWATWARVPVAPSPPPAIRPLTISRQVMATAGELVTGDLPPRWCGAGAPLPTSRSRR